MPCGFQPLGRSGRPRRREATSGHSHVCLAQKPFLLFPSVNLCAGAGGEVGVQYCHCTNDINISVGGWGCAVRFA